MSILCDLFRSPMFFNDIKGGWDSVSTLPDGAQGRYQQPSPQGADQLRGRWSWHSLKLGQGSSCAEETRFSSYFQLFPAVRWGWSDGPYLCQIALPKVVILQLALRVRRLHKRRAGAWKSWWISFPKVWVWPLTLIFQKSGNSLVVSHSWRKITQVFVPFFLLVRDRFKRIKGWVGEQPWLKCTWRVQKIMFYRCPQFLQDLQDKTVKKPILEKVVQILILYRTSSTSFSEFKLQPMVVLQEVRWELWSLWRVSHTNAPWEALGVWIQVG